MLTLEASKRAWSGGEPESPRAVQINPGRLALASRFVTNWLRTLAPRSTNSQAREPLLKPGRHRDNRTHQPEEIASDVYWLPIHGANIYFIRSNDAWVLIDAAWGNCAQTIRNAAESLFGSNVPPSAILLTHDHPDHVGAALELARTWQCPIYVHPAELALTTATGLRTIEQYANPMDRWLIIPVLRVLPRRWVASMISKGSLEGVVESLEPNGTVPALPEWTWIPTPGHSPGHVAFFRAQDRVLISGDALLTVDLGSFRGWRSLGLRNERPQTTIAPWYTNWGQRAAEESAAALMAMKPNVVASGHGRPLRMSRTEGDALGEATDPISIEDAVPRDTGNEPWFSLRTTGIRASLFVLDGLVAVTSIGGGIALATGLERDRFPLNWLQGTPFRSYTIPGLILTSAVGGSSAIAAVNVLRSQRAGGLTSALAGAILMGWITSEVLLLRQPVARGTPTERLYFAGGAAMTVLGFLLARQKD